MTITLNTPAHPGAIILDDVLPQYGLTIGQAAERLGIARPNLSLVLNGKAALTPHLAARIEAAFGVDAAMLLAMQANRDLAAARLDPAVTAIARLQPAA